MSSTPQNGDDVNYSYSDGSVIAEILWLVYMKRIFGDSQAYINGTRIFKNHYEFFKM